jgi:thioredoxin 1
MHISRFKAAPAILCLAGFSVFAGQKCSHDSTKQTVHHSAMAKAATIVSDTACRHDSAASTRPETSGKEVAAGKATSAPSKEILFFMNPNGHPCQMQLSIMDRIKDKIAPLASVKYIKTTEGRDEEMFDKYGIRGLPSLIIVDKSGKELKRFSPGIQNEETILSALKNSDTK